MNGRAGAALGLLLSLAVVVLMFLLPARWLAVPLLGLAGALALARRPESWVDRAAPVLMAVLAVLVWFADSQRVAMLYPVVVNLGLLAVFRTSLRGGPSAIERLARLEEPDLPPEGVGYTRLLTKAWCGFFAFNGACAALTAWWGDAKLWAFYNGCLAYVLIGALVGGERLARPRLLVWYRARRGLGPDVWLGLARKDGEVLCIRGGEALTWGAFRRQVGAKARAVAGSAQQQWFVTAPDAYDFAVDLLAVCLAGKSALVPQNHQADTLRALERRHPDAVVPAVMVEPATDTSEPWTPIAGGTVSFHTSGSTGEPKLITRSLEALRLEAEALEATFGEQLGSAQVLGSVPHHFIYGAIFRVLWPMRAGRVFHALPLEDGYAVVAQVRAGGDFALVGSPSMLERLPAEEVGRLSGLRAVFSSGSLLRTEVALRWSGPIEVYGSTETSGVAWRRQRVGGEPWRPLPGVSVTASADGRLHVVSPYVAPGCELTSDAVRLGADGTFELLGRVDRIAKVEGRRVSLPELEALLEAHPAVALCALVQTDGASRLAGVLVLRPELAELDAAALLAELRARLIARHDAVIAPRRWKFLPAMPVDPRGKLDQRRLRALFDPAAKPSPAETYWPQVLGWRRDGDAEVVVRLQVPKDLPYFEGHFPGLPILPGVALLSWVELLSRWFLGDKGSHVGVDNLKFTAAVYPGERLDLTLTSAADGAVRFRYETGGQPKAAGALLPERPAHVL